MNPLSNVRFIKELNQREIRLGIKESSSWHNEYKDSAWVFIGGLPYELTEGDILAVFSQYGEIVNINLVRDKATGKSKGYCFLCFEDQRSTILTVDNLNGIKLCKRTIRVDHVANYRMPKEHDDTDDVTLKLRAEGCAPAMPAAVKQESESEEENNSFENKKDKKLKTKHKKKKKKKKLSKKKNESSSSGTEGTADDDVKPVIVKKEKLDPGYEKYDNDDSRTHSRSKSQTKGSRREGMESLAGSSRQHTPDSRQERNVGSNNGRHSNRAVPQAGTSKDKEKEFVDVFRSSHKRSHKSHSSSSPSQTRSPTLDTQRHSKHMRNERLQNISISSDNICPSRSPPPRQRDHYRVSRSPNRMHDQSPPPRKLSHPIRRNSGSVSPKERTFYSHNLSSSPPPNRKNGDRTFRNSLPDRHSKTSFSPVPGRYRTSKSPPPKPKSYNESRLSRSPQRDRGSLRRSSNSPPPKRRDFGEHQQSHSSDRTLHSRRKRSASPPVNSNRGSFRRLSRSPSSDERPSSKFSSRTRSPDPKRRFQDYRRRNR